MLGKLFRKEPANPKVPPGQNLTESFPVLTYGPTPKISKEELKLRVFGLGIDKVLTLQDLLAMPQTTITKDFHCVTHWSKLDVGWTGVLTTDFLTDSFSSKEFLKLPELKDATHVMLHSYGGYTTNLDLADFLAEGCMLAHTLDNQEIPGDHGGPLRAIIPHLYAWKSAKWLNGIEFMQGDKPGFWEKNGYHMRGDPFAEERYS
jgi:DMSO/TMAO reductase YedYZ molybdopterin-dependent catalytic subunit